MIWVALGVVLLGNCVIVLVVFVVVVAVIVVVFVVLGLIAEHVSLELAH